MPDFQHHNDPQLDLDKAGFGLVAVTEDGTSRPKEAFRAVARRYGDMADGAERDERSDHRDGRCKRGRREHKVPKIDPRSQV